MFLKFLDQSKKKLLCKVTFILAQSSRSIYILHPTSFINFALTLMTC